MLEETLAAVSSSGRAGEQRHQRRLGGPEDGAEDRGQRGDDVDDQRRRVPDHERGGRADGDEPAEIGAEHHPFARETVGERGGERCDSGGDHLPDRGDDADGGSAPVLVGVDSDCDPIGEVAHRRAGVGELQAPEIRICEDPLEGRE